MRILLWHGYLLGGTGSNVYTRALACEWSRAGHEVVLFCQERHPERYDIGDAIIVNPEIETLPVFVLDRYEGLEARLLQDLSAAELERYVSSNAGELRRHLPADLVFANHVLPGAAVAAASGAPFAVAVHGSELEYSIRGRERLERLARRELERARAVFVVSAHARRALEEVVGPQKSVLEVPAGVDIEAFAPAPRDRALSALIEEARRDPPNPGGTDERLPDPGNEDRFNAFFSRPGATVAYVGKLLENKGVQLLIEALSALEKAGAKRPVKAVLVGFGDYRGELERLARERLPAESVLFTGALEHRHLRHLLPLADVAVAPSIFPEAFGMVAAEAAAAGVMPLVARHSGLAEVAARIEAEYPHAFGGWAGFDAGDARALRSRLEAILALPEERRVELGAAARRAAMKHWSWTAVAERLLAPFTI